MDPFLTRIDLTENPVQLRLSVFYQIRLVGETIREAQQLKHLAYQTAEKWKIRGRGVGYAGTSKYDQTAVLKAVLKLRSEVHSTVQQHDQQSGTSAIAS